MSVAFQIICALLLIAALVFFLIRSRSSGTGASKGQLLLSGFQLMLCGWFFALCMSDILDINVNFSYVRVVLNFFYGIAFLAVTIYTLFTKYRKNDSDLKLVVVSYIILIGIQCFVFPYGTENELLRIFEAVEGAVVFGLLIAVFIKLLDEKFCQRSLFIATVLELAVAVENVIMPFSNITDDTQLLDIPLNYMSLFMRPVLLASLALIYRVWLDGRKKAKS